MAGSLYHILSFPLLVWHSVCMEHMFLLQDLFLSIDQEVSGALFPLFSSLSLEMPAWRKSAGKEIVQNKDCLQQYLQEISLFWH